jgi:phosphate transport system substrate-binding protein
MLFNKNDKAVSPVVATLVLIVVAIIGAAAVGALLGAFSGNVGNQANAQGTSTASSTTLSVVGSTTMQPASEKLATAYEGNHQGVQINVQGGGSGAGITAVGQKIADIGSSSRAIKDPEMATYPTLQSFEVGACAAVFIANTGATVTGATQAQLSTAFSAITATSTVGGATVTVHGRSDSSGTKDVVMSWLGSANTPAAPITQGTGVITVPGSQAVEDAVATDTAGGIGYVDFGFAVNDPRVQMLPITATYDVVNRKVLGSGGVAKAFTAATTFTPTSDNILTELKTSGTAVGTKYPEGLIQPLFYITNGAPNTLQKSFIDFARSPDGSAILNKDNYFGVTQYK